MANTATSIYFDGSSDDYIQTEVNFASDVGEYTMEGWFLPTRDSLRVAIISTAGTATDDDILFEFNSDNNLRFYQRDSSGNPDVALDIDDATLGGKLRWQHLAVVRNTNGIIIYQDGVVKAYSVYSGSIPSDAQPIRFGSYDDGTIEFQGYADGIRISKTARYGNFDTPTATLDVKQTASIGMNTLKPENVTVLLQSDNSVANGTNVVGSTVNKGSGGGTINNSNGTSKIVTTDHLPWKKTSFFINGKVD